MDRKGGRKDECFMAAMAAGNRNGLHQRRILGIACQPLVGERT